MEPSTSTYTFAGDVVTYLGLLGIASTLLIVVTAFKRFYKSPYNVRVKTNTTNESPEIYTKTND